MQVYKVVTNQRGLWFSAMHGVLPGTITRSYTLTKATTPEVGFLMAFRDKPTALNWCSRVNRNRPATDLIVLRCEADIELVDGELFRTSADTSESRGHQWILVQCLHASRRVASPSSMGV
jgi:hypothetical protein